jgi:hypothetical protein
MIRAPRREARGYRADTRLRIEQVRDSRATVRDTP